MVSVDQTAGASGFIDRAQRLLKRLENIPVPVVGVLVIYVLLGLTRSMLETSLLTPGLMIATWYHWVFNYVFYFALFSLVVSWIGRRPPFSTMRASLAVVWLLITPPLIDYFILSRNAGYDYLPSSGGLKFFTVFFTSSVIGVGIRVELSLFIVAILFYVVVMTRSWRRAVAAGAVSFLLGIELAQPGAWLPVPVDFVAPGLPNRIFLQSLFVLIYAAGLLAILAAAVYRQDKPAFRKLYLSAAEPSNGIIVAACLAGLVYARQTLILAAIGPVYALLTAIVAGLAIAAIQWGRQALAAGEARVFGSAAAVAAGAAVGLSYLISGFYGLGIILCWLIAGALALAVRRGRAIGKLGEAGLNTVWAGLAFLLGATATYYELIWVQWSGIARAAAVLGLIMAGAFVGPALRSSSRSTRRTQEAGLIVFLTFLSPLLLTLEMPVLAAVIVVAGLAAGITWSGRQTRLVQPLAVLMVSVAFVYSSGLLATKVII